MTSRSPEQGTQFVYGRKQKDKRQSNMPELRDISVGAIDEARRVVSLHLETVFEAAHAIRNEIGRVAEPMKDNLYDVIYVNSFSANNNGNYESIQDHELNVVEYEVENNRLYIAKRKFAKILWHSGPRPIFSKFAEPVTTDREQLDPKGWFDYGKNIIWRLRDCARDITENGFTRKDFPPLHSQFGQPLAPIGYKENDFDPETGLPKAIYPG